MQRRRTKPLRGGPTRTPFSVRHPNATCSSVGKTVVGYRPFAQNTARFPRPQARPTMTGASTREKRPNTRFYGYGDPGRGMMADRPVPVPPRPDHESSRTIDRRAARRSDSEAGVARAAFGALG